MRKIFSASWLVIAASLAMLMSCNDRPVVKQEAVPDATTKTVVDAVTPLRERVLTAAEQKALTPDTVIQILKEGNSRFVNGNLTSRDHSAMVRNAAGGQYPKAVILSCLDSRIPVEDIFDKGIGDLFIGRIAGNFVNDDMIGSMEFGCKVSGAKLIVVMGHESCGAIRGAISNVKLGNLTTTLSKIRPAVLGSKDFSGEQSASNDAFVEHVAKKNVTLAISNILKRSPVLKEMVDQGELKIIGAYYNIKTGAVTFL